MNEAYKRILSNYKKNKSYAIKRLMKIISYIVKVRGVAMICQIMPKS